MNKIVGEGYDVPHSVYHPQPKGYASRQPGDVGEGYGLPTEGSPFVRCLRCFAPVLWTMTLPERVRTPHLGESSMAYRIQAFGRRLRLVHKWQTYTPQDM